MSTEQGFFTEADSADVVVYTKETALEPPDYYATDERDAMVSTEVILDGR